MGNFQFLIISLLMLVLYKQEMAKPEPVEFSCWLSLIGSLVFSAIYIIEAGVDYWKRKKGKQHE